MTTTFDHERLDVYRKAVAFAAWTGEFLTAIPGKTAIRDQLDRASISVPLNIAEGNGKFSPRDRCRFLEIACGSALECAAALDVALARGLTTASAVETGKDQLKSIVSMLMGLIRSVAGRVGEEGGEYLTGCGSEEGGEREGAEEREYE